MKIICLSDTHGRHWDIINIPAGDVIIQAGDISSTGTHGEIEDFLDWFSSLNFRYKIFIAGNHDFLFQRSPDIARRFIPSGISYLEDDAIEIEGLTFYGSPYTPTFFNWAFMKNPGKEMMECWAKIPSDLDVLITHGPPYGILDLSRDHKHLGCKDLSNRLREVSPRLHLFGHIHEGYGILETEIIKYCNSSILDERYRYVNDPIEIDL